MSVLRDMSSPTLDDIIVKREHGRNLSVVMGDLLFKQLDLCVLELVANSHDADAESVEITYNPKRDVLVVSDDGSGMDEDGLRSFFRIGDSPKMNDKTTPKGRRVMGNRGVATLALRTLGYRYVLGTWNGGFHYSVEERFSKDDTDDKQVVVSREPADHSKHGTTITINGLKFLREGRNLDITDLYKALSVEMPVLPDFAIFLNDEKVAPRVVLNGIEYVVDANDSLVGRVHGSIWYTSKPIKDGAAGIYIKVNGRAVGGPNSDIMHDRVSLSQRVFGVVNADSLVDVIGFDRHAFLSDSPKYLHVREIIQKVLKQVRKDMDMDLKSRDRTRSQDLLGEVIPVIGRFVGELLGDGKEYKVVFDDSTKVAYTDREDGVLHINPKSSYFHLRKANTASLTDALSLAAKHAAYRNLVPVAARDNFDDLAVQAYKAECKVFDKKLEGGSLADLVQSSQSDETIIHSVSPARLYTPEEMEKAGYYNAAVVRRMIASSLLKEKDGKVLGGDVLGLDKYLNGCIHLFDFVRRLYPNPDVAYGKAVFHANKETSIVLKLNNLAAEGNLPSYVRNLSRNVEAPFWVVDEPDLDRLKHFLETGEVRDGMFEGMYFSYRDLRTSKVVERGAVALVLEVRGEPASSVVKEALDSMGLFRRQEEVISCCSYSFFGDRNYVFGVYVGKVDGIKDSLEARGFKHVDVKGRELSVLAMGLPVQRDLKPFSSPRQFSSSVSRVIAGFYN